MRILIMAIALAFAMIQPASAAIYQQGIVYVIYEDNVIKNKADVNSNDVPDIVEDVATQVNAAREAFAAFNFPDPLQSERYKNVTSIEIDIEDKAIMKNNGIAYGSARKSKHNSGERALHIKVANTVDPHKNPTPTHEYFHLVQYGTTYFKNGWFLEGTAIWSQDAVSKVQNYPDGKDIPSQLNSKAKEQEIVKSKSGSVHVFWSPLTVNLQDKATIPDELLKKYRYTDGSEVFHDNVIYGPNVIREVLLTMKRKEEVAAIPFGGIKEWRKNGRRDERNNSVIMDCVREVYNSKK